MQCRLPAAPRQTHRSFGGELAAFDLVQHSLAGDAERLGGPGERQPALGGPLADAVAEVACEPDLPGRPEVICSPVMNPSRSQRCTVAVEMPSSLAAFATVTTSPS
jgi:hypothetical protein